MKNKTITKIVNQIKSREITANAKGWYFYYSPSTVAYQTKFGIAINLLKEKVEDKIRVVLVQGNGNRAKTLWFRPEEWLSITATLGITATVVDKTFAKDILKELRDEPTQQVADDYFTV